ncbi:hypothetical protein [Acidiphilium multivorum]|uniref:hypothetical protein n=1 Tax=Acidiphilium multivorum TaxID=62140 RepID=UPI001B8D021C|nr:hypothetical protein [Acidiphilium multivorum]
MRPITNFSKARPARRAFACLGGFLGGLPPLLDQLNKRLTAVPQATAFLDLIKERNRIDRQIEHDFPIASSLLALAISTDMFCDL